MSRQGSCTTGVGDILSASCPRSQWSGHSLAAAHRTRRRLTPPEEPASLMQGQPRRSLHGTKSVTSRSRHDIVHCSRALTASLTIAQGKRLLCRGLSGAPSIGSTTARETCQEGDCSGTFWRQGMQCAQNSCLHSCLDAPMVLHIGVPAHDQFHNRVLVQRPGCLERAAQALPISHPLVSNAVRPAHACRRHMLSQMCIQQGLNTSPSSTWRPRQM